MRKVCLLAILLTITLSIYAQTATRSYIADAGLAVRDHSLDFTHLKLQLSFDAPAGLVKGTVTHYFTPLRAAVDSFFLDGIQMTILSVSLNGKSVNYKSDSAGILIFPANTLRWDMEDSLTISYEVAPRRGLYFIGWNDPNNLSRKQIWSQGEAIDNRNWIPMYDDRNDKLVSEMMVTFDKAYEVLSNGHLVTKKENADGTNTWHYLISHPHSPYLIMLGIGKYAIKETHAASGVPMHLYYYPEWKDRVEPTFQYSEAMVNFFEKEIGVKYPWESYSQIPVQDYMFGAMENTTATVFGDFYLVDQRGVLDRNYIAVNAHELAHQWFGDYVTAKSDAHQWLQESFATYYNQLFEKEVFGEDYFNWSRRGAGIGAINESLHDKLGVAHSRASGARIYGKGAFVLNMLKYVVGGREAYNKAIKHYLEKHPYQNVDTHDLLTAFEESTGMSLDWFWDEWLYRGGEPTYQVSADDQPQQTVLAISQTQEFPELMGFEKGLFKMPVWIEVHYTDHSLFRKQYWIQQQTEIVKIPNTGHKKISFVLFDAGNEVLKTVSFSKPFAMLQAQALDATAFLDRYDAVVAMKNIPVTQKEELLIKVFHKEAFNPIRTEVILQLASDSSTAGKALLLEALKDKDAAVRKAALANIDPIASGLLPDFEKLLSDSSYQVVELALQKLATVNPSGISAYLKTTKGIEGNLGRNVLVRWLEIAYTSANKKEYANQLVQLTSSSYEFRTRTYAMGALKRVNYFSEALVINLVDGIVSPNDRLSNPAADLLRFFYGQDKYKKAISNYVKSNQWNGWQKGLLREFMN